MVFEEILRGLSKFNAFVTIGAAVRNKETNNEIYRQEYIA